MKKYYRKIDRTHRYLASPIPGVFDDIPSWFAVLVEKGKLRYTTEGMIEVRLITGAWDQATSGDCLVVQDNLDCYLVPADVFQSLWFECVSTTK